MHVCSQGFNWYKHFTTWELDSFLSPMTRSKWWEDLRSWGWDIRPLMKLLVFLCSNISVRTWWWSDTLHGSSKGLSVEKNKTQANGKTHCTKIMEESWLVQSWNLPFCARSLGHFLSLMFEWAFTQALIYRCCWRERTAEVWSHVVKVGFPSLWCYWGVLEHLGGRAYWKEMTSLVVCTWRRYCNPSLSSLFLFPEKLSCLLASCLHTDSKATGPRKRMSYSDCETNKLFLILN